MSTSTATQTLSTRKPSRPRKAKALTLIPHPNAGRKKLILRCWYSLGDITLLTAAVRDLHRSHPGKFLTDLRTQGQGLDYYGDQSHPN